MDHRSLQELREQFRVRSNHYRATTVWAKDPRIDDVIVSVVPRLARGQVGLDVGAGTGRLTTALTGLGERWINFDLSAEMLAAGRAPQAIVGDARQLPLAAQCVSAVVAQSVLPFVDYDELLTETHRVLVPNGVAVIADKVLGELRGPDEEWYHSLERARNPARRLGRRIEDLALAAKAKGYDCETQAEFRFEYQEPLDVWYERAARIPGSDISAVRRLLERRPAMVVLDQCPVGLLIRYMLTWGVLRLRRTG